MCERERAFECAQREPYSRTNLSHDFKQMMRACGASSRAHPHFFQSLCIVYAIYDDDAPQRPYTPQLGSLENSETLSENHKLPQTVAVCTSSAAAVRPDGFDAMPHIHPGATATIESGDDEAVGTSSTKPNVFFFLIDDMGYGDIGYQSTDLSELTPNLDALAAGGVKVTKGTPDI